MPKPGFVYILTNKNRSVLYTGVTSDLARRHQEHLQGTASHFTRRYKVTILVWYAEAGSMMSAISEEKRIKGGSREAKDRLIESMNPRWIDLSETLFK